MGGEDRGSPYGDADAHDSALLCDQLADQRRFLTGDFPGLADANAYCNLWFLRFAFPPATSLYEDVRSVAEGVEQVSAIGHGNRSELCRAAALEIAHSSAPLASTIAPHDAELEVAHVTIATDDYGRDPVRGVLVGSSDHDVSIGREDPQAGEVGVHLPRIGFSVPG